MKINKMVVGLIAVLVSAVQMVASGEEAQESVALPLTVQIGGRTYYNRAAMTPGQLDDMRAHDATIPVKLCDAKAASAPGYPRQGSARNCCEYISKATFTKLETGEMKIAITVSVPGILSFDDTTVYWDHGLISTKGEYSEHVHVWIDWNGDKKWSTSEMVMASSQKDYRALSNNKTLNFSKTIKIPSGAVGETYARVLLAWGDNISDPEASSWQWGDVTDKVVYPSAYQQPSILNVKLEGTGRSKNHPIVQVAGIAVSDEPISFLVTTEVDFSDYSAGKCKLNVLSYTIDFQDEDTEEVSKELLKNGRYRVVYRKLGKFRPGVRKNRKLLFYFDGFLFQGKDMSLPVYFRKYGYSANKERPNWFEFWRKDTTVFGGHHVSFDADEKGAFGFTLGNKVCVADCAASSDISRTVVNKYAQGEKRTWPANRHISLLDAVVRHEYRHHDFGPDGSPTPQDLDGDGILNSKEMTLYADYQFSTTDADTYGLGNIKWSDGETEPKYLIYGDQELLCRMEEKKARSNEHYRQDDWAYPGLQSGGDIGKDPPEDSTSKNLSLLQRNADSVKLAGNVLTNLTVIKQYSATNVIDSVKLVVLSDDFSVTGSRKVVKASVLGGTNSVTASAISTNGCAIIILDGYLLSDVAKEGDLHISLSFYKSNRRDAFLVEELKDVFQIPRSEAVLCRKAFEIIACSDQVSENGLTVGLTVDVAVSGKYEVLADVYDLSCSNLVGRIVGEKNFAVGRQTVELMLDASTLYKSKYSGRLLLAPVLIRRDSEIVENRERVETQCSVDYLSFRTVAENINVVPGSVFDELHGVDVAGRGKALKIGVSVENKSPSPDLYEFDATLCTVSGKIVVNTKVNVQLPLLTNDVAIYFSGADISNAQTDGPYILSLLSIRDLATEREVDSYRSNFQTHPYNWTQFTPIPFDVSSSNITSSVVLNSGDGKIKSLNVSAPMTLNTEGEVTISGTLVDANGNYVAHASLTEYRLAGVASFVLPFQGGDIFASGLNGPYRIVNLCVSHSSEPDYTYEEATTSMVTEAYKYDDFLPLSALYGNIPTEGLVYQLDASNPHSITTNESSEVLEWFSTDGLIRFATDDESGARPFYVPTAFGGKGGILFGSNPVTKAVGSSRMATTTDTDNQTVFIVTKPNGSQNNYGGVWGADGSSIGFSTGTSTWYPYGFAANGALYKNGTIAYGEAPMDLNAPQVVTVVSGTIQNFATAIGNFYNSADYPTRFYKGEIAEILVYDRELTDVERLSVETFLQKKWVSDAYTLFAVPANQMLLSDAQTTNVVVVGLTDWAASVDGQWLHLVDGKGSGTTNLSFSVDENLSGVSRTATIMITNATTSTKCLVTQYFKDYVDTDINFADPVTIAGDSDVVTEGTLVAAYCGSYPRTVNGVAFTSSRGTTFSAKNWWSGGNYSGGTAAPWANLSQNYRYILQSAFGTQTLYINNLKVGQTYLVQLWSNNSTSNGVNGRMSVVSGKHSVSIKQNSTGAYGGVGQYTIGYFVADRTTKEIRMSGNYLFNAIQLRKISALPTSRIEITDSVKSFIDRTVDFGDVMAGLSKRESITVKNNSATANLAITGIRTSFREDFNDGAAKHWKPDSEDNWAVVNGAYRAQNASIDSQMFSIYSGGDFADVAVQFDCWREGGATYSEGVALRATPGFNASSGSGYMFFITTDGSFSVWKVVNGISTALKSWTASSALTSTTNTVIASATGSTLALFINGKRVWKGSDSEISRGRIGLGGYTTSAAPTTHYFDNVIQGAPIPTDSTLEESLHVAESVAGSPWIAPNQVAEEDPVGAGEVQTPVSVGEPVFRVASDADYPVVLAPGASQTFESLLV